MFRSVGVSFSARVVLRSLTVIPPHRSVSRCLFSGGLVVALVAALLFVAAPAARALSYVPQTPTSVARDAAHVVIATVSALSPGVTPEGAEIDWLTLDVHEQWRGPPALRLRVRQVRTVRDAERGVRATIAGNFALEQGRTYLLFLPAEGELPTVPLTVAGESGAYLADRSPHGWAFRTLAGLPVLDVTTERWVLETPVASTVVYVAGHAPPPAPGPRADLAPRWQALVRRVSGR